MSDSARPVYFELDQALPPFGLRLPTRMTALPFADAKIALVSAVPISDALANQIAGHGEVHYLIAPNVLHHLYLGAASRRYPNARVLAPAKLRAKCPELSVHGALEEGLPSDLAAAVEMVHLDGAPPIDEFVFLHRAARALVVTELVFNLVRPKGAFSQLVFSLMGVHGKLAHSRAWRFMTNDRELLAASVERVLALDFDTLIPAHGDVIESGAHARLAHALRGSRRPRRP